MATDQSGATHWTGEAVNWAHLIIAVCGLLITLAASLVFLESRLTRLEERQAMSLRRLAEQEILLTKADLIQEAKFKEMREELLRKLDVIGADIVILKVQFAVDAAKRAEEASKRLHENWRK